jgi:hypothetical protein
MQRTFMALYGRHYMALYGTIWHYMALYGTIFIYNIYKIYEDKKTNAKNKKI